MGNSWQNNPTKVIQLEDYFCVVWKYQRPCYQASGLVFYTSKSEYSHWQCLYQSLRQQIGQRCWFTMNTTHLFPISHASKQHFEYQIEIEYRTICVRDEILSWHFIKKRTWITLWTHPCTHRKSYFSIFLKLLNNMCVDLFSIVRV